MFEKAVVIKDESILEARDRKDRIVTIEQCLQNCESRFENRKKSNFVLAGLRQSGFGTLVKKL